MKKFLYLSSLLCSIAACCFGCDEDMDQSKLTLNVSPSSVAIEEGQQQSFSFSISGTPDESTVVSIQHARPDLISVYPQIISIDPTAPNMLHNIQVTCLENQLIQGNQTIQVSFVAQQQRDGTKLTASTILVLCLDNDSTYTPVNPDIPVDPNTPIDPNHPLDGTPGILVTPVDNLKTTEEGGRASFRVVLTGEPITNVMIPIESSDPTEGVPDQSQLTFTATNWNQAQTVTVIGQDDADQDGDIRYEILLGPAYSNDELYDNMPVSSHVQCTNLDNESPSLPASFTLSTNAISIQESGLSAQFTLVPDTKPTDTVTVSLNVTDTTEARLSTSQLVFTPQNWASPQRVSVSGISDHQLDGTQKYQITFAVKSADTRYNNYAISPIQAETHDSDIDSSGAITIRTMAANITSGTDQGYSEGHGIRIFQALKPDIVMIQEFNMYANDTDTEEDIRSLVDTAFGPEFYYYQGNGDIPNGIISRYPILSSGYWSSNKISNRNWEWAVVDLPGPRDLLAISVHLSTDKNTQEIPVLMNKIEDKLAADKAMGNDYFVMIGGDFNTKKRNIVVSEMSDVFTTSAPYPADQKGNTNTNSSRNYPYDYLLCSYDWCKYEIPITIGSHTYDHGHVFDSRVYEDLYELNDVSPVQGGDSDDRYMQHMAVIRDFKYSY